MLYKLDKNILKISIIIIKWIFSNILEFYSHDNFEWCLNFKSSTCVIINCISLIKRLLYLIQQVNMVCLWGVLKPYWLNPPFKIWANKQTPEFLKFSSCLCWELFSTFLDQNKISESWQCQKDLWILCKDGRKINYLMLHSNCLKFTFLFVNSDYCYSRGDLLWLDYHICSCCYSIIKCINIPIFIILIPLWLSFTHKKYSAFHLYLAHSKELIMAGKFWGPW